MPAFVAFDKALETLGNAPAIERNKLLKSLSLLLNKEKKIKRDDSIDADTNMLAYMAMRETRSLSSAKKEILLRKLSARLFEKKNSVNIIYYIYIYYIYILITINNNL